MLRWCWCGWMVAAVMWLSSAGASAQAPTVVESVPRAGDMAVDPGLTELRVTFDRDMAGSFSWTGGGETFPQMTGKPRWLDKRTCILPVKLEGGREYRVGINSSRAMNFKSEDGVAAVAWLLRFQTAGVAATRPAEEVGRNRTAIIELNRLLKEEYSYSGRMGIDWEQALEGVRGELESASAEGFARRVGELLARAKDIHIRVGLTGAGGAGDRVGQVYKPGRRANVAVERLEKLVPGWRKVGNSVAVGKYADGVMYVMIADWSSPEEVAEVRGLIDGAARVVLDVRINGGGDEVLARTVAGRFIDKPVVYAKHRTLKNGVWGEVMERVLKPVDGAGKVRKVAVLQGPASYSSNESFIQMMSAAGATTVGTTTGGSSGNPKRHELGNSVVVWLPSWQAMRADGTVFEGQGLKADVEVEFAEHGAGMDGDAVLEAGLKVVRGD